MALIEAEKQMLMGISQDLSIITQLMIGLCTCLGVVTPERLDVILEQANKITLTRMGLAQSEQEAQNGQNV